MLFPKLGLVLTLRSAGKNKPPLERTIANSEALWSSVLDVAVFDSLQELAIFKVKNIAKSQFYDHFCLILGHLL